MSDSPTHPKRSRSPEKAYLRRAWAEGVASGDAGPLDFAKLKAESRRLVEEREAKLRALRAMLDASIAAGGEVSDAELDKALARRGEALAREGVDA